MIAQLSFDRGAHFWRNIAEEDILRGHEYGVAAEFPDDLAQAAAQVLFVAAIPDITTTQLILSTMA
jgi:hypothetical protein